MDLASQCNVFSNGFLQQINLVSGNGIILVLPHRRHWPVHKAKRLSSLSASFNNAYTQIPLFRDCYFLSGQNSSLYRLINALWECFFQCICNVILQEPFVGDGICFQLKPLDKMILVEKRPLIASLQCGLQRKVKVLHHCYT